MPERRREPAVMVTLAAVCAVLVTLRPSFVNSLAPVLPLALLAFATGSWLSRRRGLVAIPVLMASMQVAMGFEDAPNLEIAIMIVLPWLAGLELRDRRALVVRLTERQSELEEAEAAFVRLAVRRERAAIARELHDIVAHHLAVIVVQAGAGRMAGNGSRTADAERFRTIAASGEQALTEMTLLVDVLEAEPEHEGFERLPALLAQAAAGGLDVRLVPLGADLELPVEVEGVAVAVIHESLTNAIKHAPGAAVEVRLAAHGDALDVEVTDGGRAGQPTLGASGAGLGLTGLHERVAALRGTLDAGPHAGGWRVRASLPRTAGASAG